MPAHKSKKTKECPICHVIFLLTKPKDKRTVFCSRNCYLKSKKGIPIRKPGTPPWNKGKKWSKEVIKKLSLSHIGLPGNMLGKKQSLFSKIKMSSAKQGINIKDWKEFAKDKDTLERARFRREVQKVVFERDNYTCQICKKRGVSLQVDHIQPWSEYINLRFDIKNCRTLCMDCHYFITFGKKKPNNVIWGHNLKHKELCHQF